MNNKRTDWHNYFMDIAKLVATRSTCERKHVGSVIVHDRRILSTGYNGSISGQPHCDDVGHMMENNHCVRTIHAEMNAIAQAARNGVSIDSSDMYVTALPCWQCFKVIANTGIINVYYSEEYKPDSRTKEALEKTNVKLIWLN